MIQYLSRNHLFRSGIIIYGEICNSLRIWGTICIVNSCINHLGHNDRSNAMSGNKVSLELKYNIFEGNYWNLFAEVGYTLYS